MTRYPLPHGEIIRARVESVYPTIADGSVTLVHSDGPYGLGKAGWDRVRDLAAWYRPHIAEWSRICAPSASVYLWNTAEGWAAIHPEMVAAGWDFRRIIVWDKANASGLLFAENVGMWGEATEMCGVYTRGRPPFTTNGHPSNVWRIGHGGWADERLRSGVVGVALGGTTEWAEPLHPCQKPLLFARRIIEASSRPGDLVFAPFGGTCREAVAIERMAAYDPATARRYIVAEQDEDGRNYIDAVLRQIRGLDPATCGPAGQISLFGGGA